MRKAPILNAATADRIEAHNHPEGVEAIIHPAPSEIKEEIKLHCEMFDLAPSFTEVQAAKAVFLKKIQQYRPYTRYQPGSSLYMTPETAVACALAEVWRQGRKYQRDQSTDALMELAGMEVRA